MSLPEPSLRSTYRPRSGRGLARRSVWPGGHDEVAEVAAALDRIRREGDRRRLLVAALLLALGAGLWVTRERWLPVMISGYSVETAYDSTPAQTFAVGEAGFVLPRAAPVPGMSATAVAAALTLVRAALIDSYLDQRLLTGRDPGPLLALLAPDSAEVVRARLAAGGFGTALVRLAPGVRLTAPPRVNGSVRYAPLLWDGRAALDVTSNYVVAYALSRTSDRPSDVVVVHAETHWIFLVHPASRLASRGMYLGWTSGYWHGMDCAAADRGLTAPAARSDPAADPAYRDPDPLDAYFDRNRSVAVTSACR